MHYCYAFGYNALGDYIKSKGANDKLVNALELTCYQGISLKKQSDSLNNESQSQKQSVDKSFSNTKNDNSQMLMKNQQNSNSNQSQLQPATQMHTFLDEMSSNSTINET